MTVREEIQEELFYGYGMQKEDMLECMEVAIQEINDTYKRVLDKKILYWDKIEGYRQEMAMVADYWDRDAENYSDDFRNMLKQKVKNTALACVVCRNSLRILSHKFSCT